jgi:hypothetical protein
MRRTILIATIVSTIAGSAFAGRIGDREHMQQKRIAQGITSGQLTPRETVKLESREAKLNYEVRDFREDNDGTLTPRERAEVNRQQNRLSNEIYRAKHN